MEEVGSEPLAEWNPPISEESAQPSECPFSPVDQFQCTGKNCDNIRIHCSDLVRLRRLSSRWLPAISEEHVPMGPNATGRPAAFCNVDAGEVITGVSCSGKYCDNISFQCSIFEGLVKNGFNNQHGHTVSSNAPGGLLEFGPMRFAYVASCHQSYCGQLSFSTDLYHVR